MKKLLLYPVKSLLVLVAWLPWKIKQGLAFLLFLFLRYLLNYRRATIDQNMANSFPEYTPEEIRKTSRKYHLHLAQIILESLSRRNLNRAKTPGIMIEKPKTEPLFPGESQGMIVLAGHTANWEWYTTAIRELGFEVYPVYKPQSSSFADDIMLWLRSSEGIHPIPMKKTLRLVKKSISRDAKFAILLVSDQTPAEGDINFWHPFLNQLTPWFTGGEKLALRFHLPVVYLHTEKLAFGQYRFRFDPIQAAEEPSTPVRITIQYIENLENNIKEQPHAWLWSHRRWKYKPQNVSLGS